MKRVLSLLTLAVMVFILLSIPAIAVETAPSAEAAESTAVSVTSEPTEAASEEPASSESASGEASSGFTFSPSAGEFINVFSSALLLPLCFFSIILWFFRAYGMALDNKNNGWLKVYKVLRKAHIPLGAATIILGLYHTIFASINHGWSLNWGMAAMIFFLLGFFTWLFRKKLGRRWLVLHRFTTLIASICMMIHAAPYLKIVFTMIVPMMIKQLI